MNMKVKIQNILLITLAFFTISCNKDDRTTSSDSGIFYPKVERRTMIIGHFKNYKSTLFAPKTLLLYINDITIDDQFVFKTKIDNAGNFKFDIPLYHAIDAGLRLGLFSQQLFLTPYDTLYININNVENNKSSKNTRISFDEKHNKIEQKFSKVHNWFIHNNNKTQLTEKEKKDLTPTEKKLRYLTNMNKHLKKANYIIKKDTIPPLFADYLKYSITYSAYKNIIISGISIKDKENRKEYFSFITDSIAYNKKAIITSEYQNFRNFYSYEVETNTKIDIKKDGKTEEEYILKRISTDLELLKGTWGEYKAAAYINNIKYYLAYHPSIVPKVIDEKFKNPYIKQILHAKFEEAVIEINKKKKHPTEKEFMENVKSYMGINK